MAKTDFDLGLDHAVYLDSCRRSVYRANKLIGGSRRPVSEDYLGRIRLYVEEAEASFAILRENFSQLPKIIDQREIDDLSRQVSDIASNLFDLERD